MLCGNPLGKFILFCERDFWNYKEHRTDTRWIKCTSLDRPRALHKNLESTQLGTNNIFIQLRADC